MLPQNSRRSQNIVTLLRSILETNTRTLRTGGPSLEATSGTFNYPAKPFRANYLMPCARDQQTAGLCHACLGGPVQIGHRCEYVQMARDHQRHVVSEPVFCPTLTKRSPRGVDETAEQAFSASLGFDNPSGSISSPVRLRHLGLYAGFSPTFHASR
jgi:hypothetical protein